METFQKLKILLPEQVKDHFFKQLTIKLQNSEWTIREDLAQNYRNNSFSLSKNVLCLESNLSGLNEIIKSLLWFGYNNGFYEVLNIIPTNNKNLSKKEYNFILNTFYETFIIALSEKYGGQIIITSPEKLIIDTIGDQAFSALRSFSSNANKFTGNTNPYDFERWCEFIFIIFKKEIELSSTELENWFLENGWDDEVASKLALDYEYSLDLLEKYERN